uniref:Uncharacterized protein n=1 Tax=mine drainage metagenome TaxID=410659 RepID=E6PQI8_9ZZZZ
MLENSAQCIALVKLYQLRAILQATGNSRHQRCTGVTLALFNAEFFVGRGGGILPTCAR